MYEMLVVATDPGGRSGLAVVRVVVTDVNDNAPQFLLDEYKVCINSSLFINSFFLKVSNFNIDQNLQYYRVFV